MVGATTSPVFALITTGEDYLFIKCDRESAALAILCCGSEHYFYELKNVFLEPQV
jgi:hypothetical protein